MLDRYFFDYLQQYSDLPALIAQDGTELTYRGLLDRALRFGEMLGPVRRLVFLEAGNSVSHIAAYLGCLIGRHPVLLLSADERRQRDRLVQIFDPNGVVTAGGALHKRHDREIDLHPDLQVLLSTSGSTGSTKLVKLSGRNIHANAVAIGQYLRLDASERAITALKFNYSYGLSVIHSHLACGASLLLTDEAATSRRFWNGFDALGATSFAAVPVTFETLKSMGFAFSGHPALRYATQAGGRLAPETVRHFAADAVKAGARFYVMYGQTEAAPRMAYLPPDDAIRYAGCIGVAIPGGELFLIDDRGRTVTEADTPGEIVYRGPNVMMGYAGATADLAVDGTPPLLHTGDIGCRNKAGLFYIVGRAARFAKPFGVRINLDEVEQRLQPAEPDVCCAQSEDRIIVAVTDSGRRPAVEHLCRSLAAEYRIPVAAFEFLVVKQKPLLENGKPDYRAVAALHERRRRSPWCRLVRLARETAAIVWSREYIRQVVGEFVTVLLGRKRKWTNAAQIVASLANTRVESSRRSVAELDVDSLSYVQVALGLEEFLGKLPPHWEHMPLDELDELKRPDDVPTV